MSRAGQDWVEWHAPYEDAGSDLARRLRCVQELVSDWFDRREPHQTRVVSACAGQGRDLLEVMAGREDVRGLTAVLVELDPVNVAAACRLAARVDGASVRVVEGDAGRLATYAGAVPADLVLMCGVFGNISDDDVQRTIAALPMMCSSGATVIWTRHRNPPDVTPAIRQWFAEEGFDEVAFVAPEDVRWSVGVHVFEGAPQRMDQSVVMFRFS